MDSWLEAATEDVQIGFVLLVSISERRLLSEWMLDAAECLRVIRRIIGLWPSMFDTLVLAGPLFAGCVVVVGGVEGEGAGLQVRERREATSLLWSAM